MHSRIVRQVVVSLALNLLIASTSWSQSVYPPNPAYINANLSPIYPYRGTYYDPKQAGTGLQLDIGANGNAFVTYYSYDSSGKTEWYIVQSTYQPSDEATRWTTGVIGTMTGPLYQAFNGQCLTCAYQHPTDAVVTPYTANLTWVNSREVIMTVGPQRWDFIAPNFDGKPDGEYLAGSWVVSATFHNFVTTPNNTATGSGAINLVPNTIPVVLGEGASSKAAIPDGSQTYLANCGILIQSSVGLSQTVPNKFNTFCQETIAAIIGGYDAQDPQDIQSYALVPLFWYDKATNRMGLEAAARQLVNGQSVLAIGPRNLHYDLYLQGPDAIVGRGIVENPLYPNPFNVDGELSVVITMAKVPGPVAEM